MPLDQVLTGLDAATGMLAGADSQSFEQSESNLRAALEVLRVHAREPFAQIEDLHRAHEKCRRLAGLVNAAGEFYLGLATITSIQATGYGSAGAKPRSETGKRFVIDA